MGAGKITYFVYGTILTAPPHPDVVLGLARVYEATRVSAGDVPTCGMELTRGEHPWLGVYIERSEDALPKSFGYGAYDVDAAEVVSAVDVPTHSAFRLRTRRASESWDAFVLWCLERGVDIRGQGRLLVVHDYD